MKSDNLIKGQKPEFGNTDQIKWLQNMAEIFNGEINFDEIDWQYGIYIGGGGRVKPGFRHDVSLIDADCLYDYIKCPRCGRHHILLICFDPQGNWYDELIEIDKETDEGFSCWNCGLEMHTKSRMIYVKKDEQ